MGAMRWPISEPVRPMADAKLTIGAIAEQVGFQSQGAFARALYALIGERPSDYRRRIRML